MSTHLVHARFPGWLLSNICWAFINNTNDQLAKQLKLTVYTCVSVDLRVCWSPVNLRNSIKSWEGNVKIRKICNKDKQHRGKILLQSMKVGNKDPKMTIWNRSQKTIIYIEVGDWNCPNRRSWKTTWEWLACAKQHVWICRSVCVENSSTVKQRNYN